MYGMVCMVCLLVYMVRGNQEACCLRQFPVLLPLNPTFNLTLGATKRVLRLAHANHGLSCDGVSDKFKLI